ncbi:MAG: aminotransferase class III-fold pyridoxal phosphate-dependent enzyme [Reinekea sp.]
MNKSILNIKEKIGSNFSLGNGKFLVDISGGSLTQNFSNVETLCELSKSVLNHIAPSAGFESEQKRKLQKSVIAQCNKKYKDMLWSSSGSDAIESGIWAANVYCNYKYGKEIQSFIVRKGSYHGNTDLCRNLSARASGGSKDKRVIVIDECPSEEYLACNENLDRSTFIDHLKELVESKRIHYPALLLLEGKPTTGWKFNSDGKVLRDIISYCRNHEILVVLDDVASGAFRHGVFLSCGVKEEQVLPDVSIVSKGLTSGLHPLSCTLLSSDITEAVQSSGIAPLTFTHGLTEFSAVIANRCLEQYQRYFKSEESLERADAINYLAQKTRETLVSKDMWAYIGTSVMKKSGDKHSVRKYAHICPAFDLSLNAQNEIYRNLIQILSNQ